MHTRLTEALQLLFGSLTMCATYGSSSFSSAVPYVAEEYGVSQEVAILAGVSFFVLAFALGRKCASSYLRRDMLIESPRSPVVGLSRGGVRPQDLCDGPDVHLHVLHCRHRVGGELSDDRLDALFRRPLCCRTSDDCRWCTSGPIRTTRTRRSSVSARALPSTLALTHTLPQSAVLFGSRLWTANRSRRQLRRLAVRAAWVAMVDVADLDPHGRRLAHLPAGMARDLRACASHLEGTAAQARDWTMGSSQQACAPYPLCAIPT